MASAESLISLLPSFGGRLQIEFDPDSQVEASVKLGVEQADAVDHQDINVGQGLWFGKLSRGPVEPSVGPRLSLAEGLDDFGSQT